MCVISFIRNHIHNVPLDQIIFTREFLPYGIRTTIDTSLWRLVGQGMLMRVADGVFVKSGARIPSIEEIAIAKAERFGKRIVEHCKNLAADMEIGEEPRDPNLFGTDGQTSSFDTIHGRVTLAHVGERKRSMGTSKSAKATRALWFLKKPDLRSTAAALSVLSRDDRKALSQFICWMPSWLSNQFVRRVRPKKVVKKDNPEGGETAETAA